MSEPGDKDDVDACVVAPLQRADFAVDDIYAARTAAAIEAGLDARAGNGGRQWWRLWLAGAGAVATVAIVIVAALLRGPWAGGGGRQALALTPYVYSGPGADAARVSPTALLSVPAGGRVRASAGTAVRLTLVGPGSVSASTIDGVTELALDRGLLLVDFDHGAGGKLRVRAPGVVVNVVGTLFAVDARGAEPRVAVARGAVGIESRAGSRRLGAGAAWSPADAEPGAAPVELTSALAEHDASPPPPVGDNGPRVFAGGTGAPVVVDDRLLGDPPLVARIASGSRVAGDRSTPTATATVTQGRDRSTPPAAAEVHDDTPVPPQALPPSESPPPAPAAAARAGGEAEALYAIAEAQMRAGENMRARATLLDLVARYRGDPRSEAALLDLARLSLAAGATADARRVLSALPDQTRDLALAEPALHLRCRVEVVAGAVPAATSCLQAFRAQYPSSPHDAEVLAQLAALTDDCARARPLLDEYLRRYPGGAFAAQARERRKECR